MLGCLNEDYKECVIIGAGFSGLLAAYRLLQRGWRIKLYDAAARAGGLIDTAQTEYGIAEAAAHSVRSSLAMDQLFAELEIETVTARANKKYILHDGKFSTFPLRLNEIITAAARAAFIPAKPKYNNLQDWALHHLGQAALDRLIYPMMQGIYAAQPDELSPQLVFPGLLPASGRSLLPHAFMQPRGKHKARVMAPRVGMAALTEKLFNFIQSSSNGQIWLSEKISDLPDSPNMIIATPAGATGSLLQNDFKTSSAALHGIRYAPMISVTVFLDRQSHRPPKGMGILCVANEPRRMMGILFNSSSFAHRVRDESRVASYTVMLGGTRDPEILNLTDQELRQLITAEFAAVFNLSEPPLEIVTHRWPQAIPVYSPELAIAHEKISQDFCAQPGRILFGNYTGQISLRGITDTFMV